MTGINVLSLFDGMSCGRIALGRAGIKVNNYYASEIDKWAIKVSEANYPDIIRLGDVLEWPLWDIDWGSIDLVMGGSPCQGFSFAGNQLNFKDPRSELFFTFVDILNYIRERNPRAKFLLENVRMKKEYQEVISQRMEVEPIIINSNLVSFQNRARLYWTNIPGVTQPENRNISFQDHKSTNAEYLSAFRVNSTPSRDIMWGDGINGKCPNVTRRDKVNCLTVKQDRWGNSGLVEFDGYCRYLTTNELEAAQTVPLGYCDCLSKNQAEKVLGDGWTVNVIAHTLKGLKND